MSRQADITKADGFFIGEDKTLSFTIVDENQSTHPVVDITDWTLVWELSASYSGVNIFIISVDLDADPTTGVCNANIPGTETEGLQADRDYWYTLRRTDLGSHEELAFGNCWLRDVWVDY